MPSNRAKLLTSKATRNEDKPDPCEVKLNEGNEGMKRNE